MGPARGLVPGLVLTFLSLMAMGWAALEPGRSGVDAVAARTGQTVAWSLRALRAAADGDRPDWRQAAVTVFEGDAGQGAALILRHGCGGCHVIPGIAGTRGRVGPPLNGIARRAYIAGVLPNTPDGLVRWLMDPPRHAPRTVMPDLGVTEPEARHIAAYLLTLREAR